MKTVELKKMPWDELRNLYSSLLPSLELTGSRSGRSKLNRFVERIEREMQRRIFHLTENQRRD